MQTKFSRVRTISLFFLLTGLFFSCQAPPESFTLMLCLDGATPGIIESLRSKNQLPTLDLLSRQGSHGLLESVQSLPISEAYPKKGYFSPVVWTSIATGKIPQHHGVLDFSLPKPGTSFVWAGGNSLQSKINLPEIQGSSPFQLKLRLRSYEANGSQSVVVSWNGHIWPSVEIATKWQDFTFPLPDSALYPIQNKLQLSFSKQVSPSAKADSKDQRLLAGALGLLEVTDALGLVVLQMDPVYDRFWLAEGFYPPEAVMIEAQTVHWKARPVWDFLGSSKWPVGIIGYWATWPASKVHGFLVSSHLGLRGKKRETRLPNLTWPPSLAEELDALAPNEDDLKTILAELYPPGCTPGRPDKIKTFEEVLWQDEYFFRIAQKMIQTQSKGLFSVYFEALDVGSHNFLPFYDGEPLPPGCPESVREIVPKLYQSIDRKIGMLIEKAPAHATILAVSDHGLVTFKDKGEHHPYGIFIAKGPHIKQNEQLHDASALDVAPTLLHIFNEPIPLDMQGKTLVNIFEPSWLIQNPPQYRLPEKAVTHTEEARTEATDEVLEKLKGIGYFE